MVNAWWLWAWALHPGHLESIRFHPCKRTVPKSLPSSGSSSPGEDANTPISWHFLLWAFDFICLVKFPANENRRGTNGQSLLASVTQQPVTFYQQAMIYIPRPETRRLPLLTSSSCPRWLICCLLLPITTRRLFTTASSHARQKKPAGTCFAKIGKALLKAFPCDMQKRQVLLDAHCKSA